MKQLIPIAVCFFVLHSAFGISVSMDVQPRAVQLGESAMLSITADGMNNAPTPNIPAMPGLQVSAAGTQSSLQLINGSQSMSVTHTYQLIPTRTGTFTIGPYRLEAQGQVFELAAIQLQVVAPGQAATSSAERNAADLLFATITADSPKIYHQQAFDITLSIFSRGLNLDRNVELLDINAAGLRLQQFRPVGDGREVVHDQVYDVRRFRCRATALTAGQFTLSPRLRVGLITQSQRRRDMFEVFFGFMESRPTDITVKPLELDILPLPDEGRPEYFSGAVGRFVFDAHVSPLDLNAGDPATLTMTLTGEGNIDVVSPPQIVTSDGFRVYEPKMTLNEVDTERGVGRKIFEQVIIPKSNLATNLAPLTFSYFDPESGHYQTSTRGPFTFAIRPGTNEAQKMVQAAAQQTERARVLLGADIGYLKAAPSRWHRTGSVSWLTNPAVLGLQAAPPVALALIFFAVRRRDALNRDVSKFRRVQAPKAARAAIASAELALAAESRLDFYEAVWRALASYFGHRFNLAPGEVTRDGVLDRLRPQMKPDQLDQLTGLFDRCEQERFGRQGGGPLSAEGRSMIQQLSDILRACEGARR